MSRKIEMTNEQIKLVLSGWRAKEKHIRQMRECLDSRIEAGDRRRKTLELHKLLQMMEITGATSSSEMRSFASTLDMGLNSEHKEQLTISDQNPLCRLLQEYQTQFRSEPTFSLI